MFFLLLPPQLNSTHLTLDLFGCSLGCPFGFLSWCRVVRVRLLLHVLCVGQLVVLLPLHAPVLEPDLNLSLGQDQCVGNLNPSPTRQIAVVMELLLQLKDLVARVGRPLSLWFISWGIGAVGCNRGRKGGVNQSD